MVASNISPDMLEAFIQEVRDRTGVHLDPGKATMLSGRIRRRIRTLELDGFESYLQHLRRNRNEEAEFIHAVTTHKTDLFRTRGVWRHLWEVYLPTMGRRVHAWSAACSTGEEPASLGVLLQSHAQRTPGFRYEILATDISAPVVETARRATFTPRALGSVGTPFGSPVQQHFEAEGVEWRLTTRIRAATTYRTHNLFNRMQGKFDLIMVRNVIIYFTPEDKAKVIHNCVRALAPGGMLVVGESESLLDLVPELENVGHCLYRQRS